MIFIDPFYQEDYLIFIASQKFTSYNRLFEFSVFFLKFLIPVNFKLLVHLIIFKNLSSLFPYCNLIPNYPNLLLHYQLQEILNNRKFLIPL